MVIQTENFGGYLGKTTGNPWVFFEEPLPVPVETHPHPYYGYRFLRVRVMGLSQVIITQLDIKQNMVRIHTG